MLQSTKHCHRDSSFYSPTPQLIPPSPSNLHFTVNCISISLLIKIFIEHSVYKNIQVRECKPKGSGIGWVIQASGLKHLPEEACAFWSPEEKEEEENCWIISVVRQFLLLHDEFLN